MRKSIASVLAALLVIGLLAGCGSSGQTSGSTNTAGSTNTQATTEQPQATSEEPYEVTLMYSVGTDYPDQDEVTAAMQELALKELNMKLNVVTVPSSYTQQLTLRLTGGEPLDVFPIPGSPMTYISNGYCVDLGDLIDKYGNNIKSIFGDEAKIANINGYVYAIPIVKERDYAGGMIMRKDILDQCGLDLGKDCENLNSLEDLTEVFATVHEKFPNMVVFGGGYAYTPASMYLGRHIDNIGSDFGVLLDPVNDTTVSNWFESDEYIRRCKLMREWYLAGYVQKDLATSTDSGTQQMRAGNLFCDFDLVKPYRDVEATLATGYECVYFPFDEPLKNSCTLLDGWGIATNSENPDKAMQFLDYLYGSAEFMDLWNWGIEGKHFVYQDKGNSTIVTYPEGVDMDNVGYHQNRGWTLPNQYIAGIWEGNPADLADVMTKYNADMDVSLAYGFQFDAADYETEIANLTAIRDKYAFAIGSGSVDPETEIPKFNEELYAAGLQKVMDAKQEQLNAWLANK